MVNTPLRLAQFCDVPPARDKPAPQILGSGAADQP